MSYAPHTIGQRQTLAAAHRMMREHRTRHLPVFEGDRLVGLVSQQDVALVESLKDVDPGAVVVEEAMSPRVYQVSPEAPLDEVVFEMAQHRYRAAVVAYEGQVFGVFTAADAMGALAEILRTRPPG